MERKLIQDMYIRVCKDSRFSMGPVKAAQFTGQVLTCHPLEVWLALGWSNMEQIATGKHPVCAQ